MAAKPSFNWPEGAAGSKVDPKKDLSAVHWQIGYREGGSMSVTETRDKYVPKPITKTESFAESNGKDLKDSHIDLAAGEDKSGKHWKTVQTHEMSKAEAEKFACRKPPGFEALGAELRKSNISLDQGVPCPPEEVISQQKSSFAPPAPTEQAASFAASLGKELRTSRIDLANGQPRSASSWVPVQTEAMSRHAKEKFNCEKPAGFEALGKELRKSSVPLSMPEIAR